MNIYEVGLRFLLPQQLLLPYQLHMANRNVSFYSSIKKRKAVNF